ncbi:MAG: DUF484 family protein [Pseudomonadota bacterium]
MSESDTTPAAEAAGAPAAAAEAPGTVALDPAERELVRSLILADPALVLDDDGVMRALIQATGPLERNVVDLRDRLVERLETRLRRLADANRSMMAAAYENVASTEAVHAVVTELMAARDLAGLAAALAHALPARVSIAGARLVLEADVDEIRTLEHLGPGGHAVVLMPRGAISAYLGQSPRQDLTAPETPAGPAPIVLRRARPETELVFGEVPVASEALLPLDLHQGEAGAPGPAGLLALGASDPDRFTPDQATDLLAFLAAVTAHLARQHLAALDRDDAPVAPTAP